MIDWVKIFISNFNPDLLLNHPNLNFVSLVNTDTGEIKYNKFGTLKKYADYNNLKFILIENKDAKTTLLIEGSLHKYYNDGKHNYDDFTYDKLQFALNNFSDQFQIELTDCILQNIEFGVNIVSLIQALLFQQGLISHRNTPFKRISLENADYYQVVHPDNFFIKIYDKAKQYRAKGYPIPNEILRYELKYVKMESVIEPLKEKGLIYKKFLTLNDLLNMDILNALGEMLISKLDEVLFYDHTIFLENPDNIQKLNIANWQNPVYWENLDRRKKHKETQKLNDLTDKYSDHIKTKTINLVKDKLESLIPTLNPFDDPDFNITDYDQEGHFELSSNNTFLRKETVVEKGQWGQKDSIAKGAICPQLSNNNSGKSNYQQWISYPKELPF